MKCPKCNTKYGYYKSKKKIWYCRKCNKDVKPKRKEECDGAKDEKTL